jgi:hypothetical protein
MALFLAEAYGKVKEVISNTVVNVQLFIYRLFETKKRGNGRMKGLIAALENVAAAPLESEKKGDLSLGKQDESQKSNSQLEKGERENEGEMRDVEAPPSSTSLDIVAAPPGPLMKGKSIKIPHKNLSYLHRSSSTAVRSASVLASPSSLAASPSPAVTASLSRSNSLLNSLQQGKEQIFHRLSMINRKSAKTNAFRSTLAIRVQPSSSSSSPLDDYNSPLLRSSSPAPPSLLAIVHEEKGEEDQAVREEEDGESVKEKEKQKEEERIPFPLSQSPRNNSTKSISSNSSGTTGSERKSFFLRQQLSQPLSPSLSISSNNLNNPSTSVRRSLLSGGALPSASDTSRSSQTAFLRNAGRHYNNSNKGKRKSAILDSSVSEFLKGQLSKENENKSKNLNNKVPGVGGGAVAAGGGRRGSVALQRLQAVHTEFSPFPSRPPLSRENSGIPNSTTTAAPKEQEDQHRVGKDPSNTYSIQLETGGDSSAVEMGILEKYYLMKKEERRTKQKNSETTASNTASISPLTSPLASDSAAEKRRLGLANTGSISLPSSTFSDKRASSSSLLFPFGSIFRAFLPSSKGSKVAHHHHLLVSKEDDLEGGDQQLPSSSAVESVSFEVTGIDLFNAESLDDFSDVYFFSRPVLFYR